MIKLISVSDDEWSIGKFGSRAENIRFFLEENNLDGLELMHWQTEGTGEIPMDRVVGRHMLFWPNWLDFWRSDRTALLREFDCEQNWHEYYHADTPEKFMEGRHSELEDAARMGVRYVVFHVSHVQMEHCYTGRYSYTDREIIDAFTEMLNGALRGISGNFTVLLENHWFPGLTLLEGSLAMRLLDGINWPDKGFVLDISHLMNTSSGIKSEPEGVAYIIKMLDRLGEAKYNIKTIHLNSSVPVNPIRNMEYCPREDYMTRLVAAMKHVGSMDPHAPFAHPSIRRVIDSIMPEYLVNELKYETLEELQNAVRIQSGSIL